MKCQDCSQEASLQDWLCTDCRHRSNNRWKEQNELKVYKLLQTIKAYISGHCTGQYPGTCGLCPDEKCKDVLDAIALFE